MLVRGRATTGFTTTCSKRRSSDCLSEQVILEDVGPYPMMEHPGEVTEVIADFVNQ